MPTAMAAAHLQACGSTSVGAHRSRTRACKQFVFERCLTICGLRPSTSAGTHRSPLSCDCTPARARARAIGGRKMQRKLADRPHPPSNHVSLRVALNQLPDHNAREDNHQDVRSVHRVLGHPNPFIELRISRCAVGLWSTRGRRFICCSTGASRVQGLLHLIVGRRAVSRLSAAECQPGRRCIIWI